MRAVQISAPGSVQVITTAEPAPGPGEVLVRVNACGICGTDVHIAAGTYMGSYPVIPGHEFAGVVEAAGPGTERIRKGMTVAVEPNLPCNNCPACLRNQQNHCEHWKAIGVTLPGAMADLVVVPESAAFDVGGLDPAVACLMEPLSCVLHGVDKLDVRPGDSAAVVGAGPIGLLLCSVLALRGVRTISLVERNPGRLEGAAPYLASIPDVRITTARSTDQLPSSEFDIAVDATGVPEVVRETLRLVRAGGQCLWFGVPATDATLTIEPFVVFEKGLSIYGAFTSLRNSQEALRVLASGTIPVEALITREVGLDDVASILSELHSGTTSELKCIVRP